MLQHLLKFQNNQYSSKDMRSSLIRSRFARYVTQSSHHHELQPHVSFREHGKKSHRASLDGLRGLATIAVVGFHFELPGFELGFFGVDLFLVLSGFLITKLIVLEHQAYGALSLGRFWMRRMLRLWPLYYFYTSLLVAMLYFGLAAYPRHDANLYMVRLWLYMSNLDAASVGETELTLGAVGISSHLWSLALEEQFYLVWPWLCGRALRSPRVTALVLCVPCVQWISLQFATTWPDAAFLPWTRGFSLSMGCAAALSSNWITPLLFRLDTKLIQTGCAILIVLLWWAPALFPFQPVQIFQYLLPILVLPIALLCALLWDDGDSVVARSLSFPPLVKIGVLSYGIYIWHPMSAALISMLFKSEQNPVLQPALAAVLVLGLADFSYRFYERPFLRLKRRYARV